MKLSVIASCTTYDARDGVIHLPETSTSLLFTAPFNNMQTLKFKAQPTNAFFATVNQMFGGSSQLPTTAKGVVIKSLSTIQTTNSARQ